VIGEVKTMPKKQSRTRKKQEWSVGSIFSIELDGGVIRYGQVVAADPRAFKSVVCALFDKTFSPNRPLSGQYVDVHAIASIFTTQDLLDLGVWKIVCNADVYEILLPSDYEEVKKRDFIRQPIHGSKIIMDFLKATEGQLPWTHYKDPEYFDKMLRKRRLS
jgi:hypothetical protein